MTTKAHYLRKQALRHAEGELILSVQAGALPVTDPPRAGFLLGRWTTLAHKMAARLRKTHQDDVRLKIQASQLINRLTDHAFDKITLSATQIKCIEILLKKSVADLSSIEISGNDEKPLPLVIKWQSAK